MFEQLTNYIEIFASAERFGTRRGDRVKDGRVISLEMPYVDYSAPVKLVSENEAELDRVYRSVMQ